jgi:hypothetical protein
MKLSHLFIAIYLLSSCSTENTGSKFNTKSTNELHKELNLDSPILNDFEYFNGWIMYSNNPDASLEQLPKSYMIQYMQGEAFKGITYTSKDTITRLYRPADKKVYMWTSGSNFCTVIDISFENVKILNVEYEENMDTILGFPCKTMMVTNDKFQTRVWYPTHNFMVKDSIFKGFKYDYLEDLYKSTKSVPLKFDIDVGQIISTKAFAYKNTLLEDSIFDLPSFEEFYPIPPEQ